MHIVGIELACIGLILDFNRQIKVLEDAVKQCQRALNLNLHVEQLADREEDSALERRECDDTTKRDSRVWVLNNLITGDQVDDCGRNREKSADEHEKPTPDHLLSHLKVGQLLVLSFKLVRRVFLASKGFDEQDAAHGEGFLHHGGQRSQALLCLLAGGAPYITNLIGDP